VRRQRDVELDALAGEVLAKLGRRLAEHRAFGGRRVLGIARRRVWAVPRRLGCAVRQVHLDEDVVLGDERDRADRAVDGRALTSAWLVHGRFLSHRWCTA
jgi:hypothetical protein